MLSVWQDEQGAPIGLKVLQLPKDTTYYDAFLKYVRERLKQTNIVSRRQPLLARPGLGDAHARLRSDSHAAVACNALEYDRASLFVSVHQSGMHKYVTFVRIF